jgi:hypothetical protein
MAKSLAEVAPPIPKATGVIHMLRIQTKIIQTTHPDIVPVVADFILFSSVYEINTTIPKNPFGKNRL